MIYLETSTESKFIKSVQPRYELCIDSAHSVNQSLIMGILFLIFGVITTFTSSTSTTSILSSKIIRMGLKIKVSRLEDRGGRRSYRAPRFYDYLYCSRE